MTDKPGFTDFWDAMYRRGEHIDCWEEAEPSAEFLAAIAALDCPAGSRVLDLGCGSGLEACHMAARGYLVSGIDISPAAIELASARAMRSGLQADFRIANALQLPFADGSFRLLLDRGCLHLIPHAHWPAYAGEAARVLQPSGQLLLRGCSDAGNPDFHALSGDQPASVFQRAGLQIESRTEIRLANRRGGLPALQLVLRRSEPYVD